MTPLAILHQAEACAVHNTLTALEDMEGQLEATSAQLRSQLEQIQRLKKLINEQDR
jgi:hypothetical protein